MKLLSKTVLMKKSTHSLTENKTLESKIAKEFDKACLENNFLEIRIDTKGILTPGGFGKNDQEGAPDRIIAVPLRLNLAIFVAVELKRPRGGKYSPKQILWKRRIEAHGGQWYGIHTLEAIQNFISDIKSLQTKLQGILCQHPIR
jgi:hypothetical protein